MSIKMMCEISVLQRDLAELKKKVEDLTARLEEAEKKRGPGRPRKDAA